MRDRRRGAPHACAHPHPSLDQGPRVLTRQALGPRPTVALLTEAAFLGSASPQDWYAAQVRHEDALLEAALAARGVGAERVAWDGPEVFARPWDAALIRATWDYHVRLGLWEETLSALSRRTRLLNPWPTLAWNLDKRYLLELAGRGIPVVPTEVVDPGAEVDFNALAARFGAHELVAKPAVSGGARATFRLGPAELASPPEAVRTAMARERFLVQPFESAILTEGELSLVVIGGRLTHAVRKTPRPGDFRVQDDHGGRVHSHLPGAEARALAEAVVAAVSPLPVYARVDMVRQAREVVGPGTAARGPRPGYALMELELIEPELFLRCEPSAASALADAVVAALGPTG